MKIRRFMERGDAHTALLVGGFVALVGVVGFVGFNAWQKQQTNAGGQSTVASAERKVKTIQTKLDKARSDELKNKGNLDRALTTSAMYNKALEASKGDPEAEADVSLTPEETKDVAATAKRTASADSDKMKKWATEFNTKKQALITKRNAETSKNATLKTNFDKKMAAWRDWSAKAKTRDAAKEERETAAKAFEQNDSDANEQALKQATKAYKSAHTATREAYTKLQADRVDFEKVRDTWKEYKAYDKHRKPMLKATSNVKKFSAKAEALKDKIADLRQQLASAKKAANKAKTKASQQKDKSKSNNNSSNGSNTNTPAKTKKCNPGFKLNSTKTTCYKYVDKVASTVTSCPKGYDKSVEHGQVTCMKWVDSIAERTSGGGCPSGYKPSQGGLCKGRKAAFANATRAKVCPSGSTPSGSSCAIYQNYHY